jgi:superfamily I DNA/RNA helicase
MKKLVEKRFLSAEQVTAIEHPLEPVAIIAGAGTGKTEVMSQRVKYLIESNQVDPASVLGLTFMKESQDRLARSTEKSYQQFQLIIHLHDNCLLIMARQLQLNQTTKLYLNRHEQHLLSR